MNDEVAVLAGGELSAAVADAVGLRRFLDNCGDRENVLRAEYEKLTSRIQSHKLHYLSFNVHENLSRAMEVAEAVGVFEFGRDALGGSTFLDRVVDGGVPRWRVCEHRYHPGDICDGITIQVLAVGDTPAEAVCRAIINHRRLEERVG